MIELKEIQNFIKDKNVLIVGNNDSINKEDNSKIIDSFDVVIRINHAIPEKNIGMKTDIWACFYTRMNRQYNEFVAFKPKYIIRGYAKGNTDKRLLNTTYDLPVDEFLKDVRDFFSPSNPSSGISIIDFIKNKTNPKSINIIGFDGFDTKTFYNKAKVSEKWHNKSKEKMYIQKLIEKGSLRKIN